MKRARPMPSFQLPTKVKTWAGLHIKWLSRLLQELDNDWILAQLGEHLDIEIDRETLERILHCAVSLLPGTAITERHFGTLASELADLYVERGQPLKAKQIADFQQATPLPAISSQAQAAGLPGHGTMPQQGVLPGQGSFQEEGPELATTPDGRVFLCHGQKGTPKFLAGGTADWELGCSKSGYLVFSPSLSMAGLVDTVLNASGHDWPPMQCFGHANTPSPTRQNLNYSPTSSGSGTA